MEMTVSDILKLQLKDQLYARAVELKLKGRSSCNKDALAERIADVLLAPEYLEQYLMRLDEKMLCLFERAIETQVMLEVEEEQNMAQQFQKAGYGYIDSFRCFCVPVTVKNSYASINRLSFCTQYERLLWLRKCMNFCIDIMGIVPDDILTSAFNSKQEYHATIREIVDMYTEYKTVFDNCKYESGIFLCTDMPYSQVLKLLGRQKGRKFYIPSRRDINDYYSNHFLLENHSYQTLYQFMNKQMLLSQDETMEILRNVWKVNSKGEDLFLKIGQLVQEQHFQTADMAVQYIRYLLDTYNHTRLRDYRGHTPFEMRRLLNNTNGTVTIMGRPEETCVIRSLTPVLAAKGFYIGDLPEEEPKKPSEHVQRKIYPNEPCPCGSGIKFKKCCGRFQ